jgi:G3E family GTPase
LTILLDGVRDTAEFPEIVTYLYHKQLAEADLIALNKADLLDPAYLEQRRAELAAVHPEVRLMSLSARTGEGLNEWLELVLNQTSPATQPLEIDYDKYAEAEARLGWLNVKGTLRTAQPFAATTWTHNLLAHLAKQLAAQAAPIAHLKLNLKTPGATLKASLTGADQPISWDVRPDNGSQTDRAQFILNARVNTDPRTLEQIVREALEQVKPSVDTRYDLTHFECFSPLPPQPTHRLGVAGV